MRIAIVAGEASGDILGAGLIKALRARHKKHCESAGIELDELEFFGIGGAKMQAQGFHSLFAMERLSVMGLVEPLKRLPELLSIRKTIKQQCIEQQVDCFIGIDSPDFNLNIERFTKSHGIKTVHYVSPSVWAWRQGRIKGIKKSVDLMLTLLPFEASFYRQHEVPVCFVGHPLADDIAIDGDKAQARQLLEIPAHEAQNATFVALMPGSRGGEVRLLGELFLGVASSLQHTLNNCIFLLPAANADRREQLEQLLPAFDHLDVRLYDGQSHHVMEAADAILLASGTTALEAMLYKRPMVVSYKMAPLSYAIISRLVKSKYVSLPNLLADKTLVPELLQDAATVENLTAAMLPLLTDGGAAKNAQVEAFYALHQSIRCDASFKAAEAIWELLDD